MKRYLYNNQGIALVTSLMMTLISMAVIMALLYMITGSTQRSGATKRYKSGLDAGTGGAQLVVKDLMPYLMDQFQNYTSTQVTNHAKTDFSPLIQDTSPANCLKAKINQPTGLWPSACSATFNPKSQPDVTMTLQATTSMPFTVYAKIVDTVGGNTELGGSKLDEVSGVAYLAGTNTVQHLPYVYRLEVQAERQQGSIEKSNISILYAY
jgi:hypothetical protein